MWSKVYFLCQWPTVACLCRRLRCASPSALHGCKLPLSPSILNVRGKVIECLQIQIQVWTITVLLSWAFKTGPCGYLKPEAGDGAEVLWFWKWASTMLTTQKVVCVICQCEVPSERSLRECCLRDFWIIKSEDSKGHFLPAQAQTTPLDQNSLITCMAFFFTDF